MHVALYIKRPETATVLYAFAPTHGCREKFYLGTSNIIKQTKRVGIARGILISAANGTGQLLQTSITFLHICSGVSPRHYSPGVGPPRLTPSKRVTPSWKSEKKIRGWIYKNTGQRKRKVERVGVVTKTIIIIIIINFI